MVDGTSIENDLEMPQSGRNEVPTMVVVDKYSKSSLCNDGEEPKEQTRDHLVANEEVVEILMKNDDFLFRGPGFSDSLIILVFILKEYYGRKKIG